jgi:hypothetical protein
MHGSGVKSMLVVGLYRLTPPDPQLKGAWYPGGFNPCTCQTKTWFQAFAFKCNVYRYIAARCVDGELW